MSRLRLEVACTNRAHPHERAHHATGVTDDGVRFSLFWWQPEGVAEHPGERADGHDDGPDDLAVDAGGGPVTLTAT